MFINEVISLQLELKSIIKKILIEKDIVEAEITHIDRSTAVKRYNVLLQLVINYMMKVIDSDDHGWSAFEVMLDMYNFSYVCALNGHNDIAYRVHDFFSQNKIPGYPQHTESSNYVIACCLKYGIECPIDTEKAREVFVHLKNNSLFQNVKTLSAQEIDNGIDIYKETRLNEIRTKTFEGIDIHITEETKDSSADIVIKYYDLDSSFYKNNWSFAQNHWLDKYKYNMWIQEYIGSKDVIYLSIPGKFKGKPIQEITGFRDLENLKTVNIGEGIEEIDQDSFTNCVSLKEITIPKTCNRLRAESFKMCKSLPRINLSNVISISWEVFLGCEKLEEVILSKKIEQIGKYAFAGCSNLKNIELSNNLRYIGDYAFADCFSIDTIVLPASISNLGDNIFYGWQNWQTIIIHSNLKNSNLEKKLLSNCKAKIIYKSF